ncbi:GNAT family N-acetyltransferase [Neptuniibacter sp.]|uniref:GNAT family N-acetyltransferase n=1 Tax=Neptuniibacter sp. TaxID=1962643 RepID=UPI00262F0F89|nr:GNAT family N-acetyltransferase [Neptuniibacter sp.]MCP4595809.1 GNAT family N-acetyltransferase [Neptuniibacter sp.]
MQYKNKSYFISDDRDDIQLEQVTSLLMSSYWAQERSLETIKTSIQHSICFSLFCDDVQVGFARVVTDFSSVAYIADFIIQAEHRSKGIGKWMFGVIVNDPRWSSKFQFLVTDDAHGLYERYGFSGSHKLMSTEV